MKKVAYIGLAILGLLLSGPAAFGADEKANYTVVVKKVEVKTTKADGSSWDINDGKPDLCVAVRNASVKDARAFKTKTKDDAFSADFDEPTTVKFAPGQKLEFEVLDVDAALNDSIGKKEVEITAAMIKDGKLKLEKFGQVITLELSFKKL